jgi:nucleoside phosphorylase
MTDHILAKITYDPTTSAHHAPLNPIPWPDAVRPMALPFPSASFGPETLLPRADSVIVTWTSAEWTALTDVLAPGAEERRYVGDFQSYLPDLTNRSPAKDAGCLARFRMAQANGRTVLLVHSMLHLATDGPNLPLRRLIDAIIEQTGCARLVTTGTAGGIGEDAQLGDVVIANACRFYCQKQFRDAPFAGECYPTMYAEVETGIAIKEYLDDGVLVAANLGALASVRAGEWKAAINAVITTDFFCFSTSDDHYGLRTYAPELNIGADGAFAAVEMDDAVFGLTIADRLRAAKPAPQWVAVRNASDPEADMTKYATEEDAATAMGLIYRRWGYLTTIPSAIVSWLIAVV